MVSQLGAFPRGVPLYSAVWLQQLISAVVWVGHHDGWASEGNYTLYLSLNLTIMLIPLWIDLSISIQPKPGVVCIIVFMCIFMYTLSSVVLVNKAITLWCKFDWIWFAHSRSLVHMMGKWMGLVRWVHWLYVSHHHHYHHYLHHHHLRCRRCRHHQLLYDEYSSIKFVKISGEFLIQREVFVH